MKKLLKSDYIRKDEMFADSAGLLLSMSSFSWQVHIENWKNKKKSSKSRKILINLE